MASKSQNFRYLSYAILVVGILVLIAGAVMLGIGISKYNDASMCVIVGWW
jgi:hypothetical protein